LINSHPDPYFFVPYKLDKMNRREIIWFELIDGLKRCFCNKNIGWSP